MQNDKSGTVVLVHLGESTPRWLVPSIRALQTMHGASSVAVVAEARPNLKAAEGCGAHPIHYSAAGTVERGLARSLGTAQDFRSGFWLHSSRRLVALVEASERIGGPIVHVETDVVALHDLRVVVPRLRAPIAFPVISRGQGSGAVVYIQDAEAARWLGEQVISLIMQQEAANDMQALWRILASNPEMVQELPAVSHDGWGRDLRDSPVEHARGDVSSASIVGLFDAAAIGQFLLGPDPRNNRWGLRPIGETFGPESFKAVAWSNFLLDETDGLRWTDGQISCPVMSLHVHSKDLRAFEYGSLFQLLKSRLASSKASQTWDPWALRENVVSALVRRLSAG
jgi:hypothetical protein